MRRTLLLLLLGIRAVAIAQAPPDEEPAPAADAGGQALPCLSATDAPQAPAGKSGPLEGQPEGAEPAAVPCEGQAAEAEDVFEPGDEISEDYPVPLPADI